MKKTKRYLIILLGIMFWVMAHADIHVYATETSTEEEIVLPEDCAEHYYGQWTIIKKPTIYKEGSRRHTCDVCGYVETVRIPKMPATVGTNVEGGICMKSNSSFTYKITYISPGDSIKSIEMKANKYAKIKSVSKDKRKIVINSIANNGFNIITIKLKSGIMYSKYVWVGQFPEYDRNKYVNSDNPILNNVSASKKFYNAVKKYIDKDHVPDTNHIPRGTRLEFRLVCDKNNKYFATKSYKKVSKRVVITLNEYKYKQLKDFDYNLIPYECGVIFTDTPCYKKYAGWAFNDAPVVFNGNMENIFFGKEEKFNVVFDEQVKFFEKMLKSNTYKHKWLLDGSYIEIINCEDMEELYRVEKNRKEDFLRIYIDRDKFDETKFTQNDMTKIIKEWEKSFKNTPVFFGPSFVHDRWK